MKILISTRTLESPGGFSFDGFERGFYSLFEHHELTALINKRNQNFNNLAAEHDLLVLSGGDDHPARLLAEIEMIKQFRLRKKPILGICHGAFLLTQLMGGQCVPVTGHRRTEHVIWYKYQQRLVNSYHGSAITAAPNDAKVLATDDAGNIESWQFENVMAIVWHPERDLNQYWMPDEFYLDILKESSDDNDR
jgi:gamma-glutamyl-gamma-aminobutyrate hydrolase PuuD